MVVEQKNYNQGKFSHDVFQIRQRIKYCQQENRRSVRNKHEVGFLEDKNYIGKHYRKKILYRSHCIIYLPLKVMLKRLFYKVVTQIKKLKYNLKKHL